VNQQVDVAVFAVELHQFSAEAVTYLDHDVFAAVEEFVGERRVPVLRSEDRASVQVVGCGKASADIGVRVFSAVTDTGSLMCSR
jgi:hypothetical protein